MRTTDLFKNNRSAKKLNESLQKTFGKHIDLKSMDLPRLEDARNKLRTQLHDARSQSGFNENLENEAMTQAQWMLDAINAEIAEREEFIADPHQAEISMEEDETAGGLNDPMWRTDEVLTVTGEWDEEYYVADSPHGPLLAAWDVEGDWYHDQDGGEVEGYISFVVNIATGELVDFKGDSEDSGPWKGISDYATDEFPEEVANYIKEKYGSTYEEIASEVEGGMEVDSDDEPGGSYDGSDDAEALASAGFGSDEDYGYFGQDEAFDADANPGDTFKTKTGIATKTKTGLVHKRDFKAHGKRDPRDNFPSADAQVSYGAKKLEPMNPRSRLSDEPKENFGPLAARREKSSNSRIYDLYMDGMDAEEIGRRLGIEDTGMIQDVIDQIEANGGEPIGEASDNLADLFMQMAKDQGLSLSQRGTPDEERAKRDDMIKQRDADRANEPKRLPPTPEERARLEAELKKLKAEFDPNYQYSDDHNFWSRQNSLHKNIISIKQRLSQTDESVAMEKAPPGGKYERMVKHIKKGYAKDGKLSDKEKSIAYATAWKQKNKDTNESVTTGENMTRRLTEGEIQQASAIVNAKTMVDRVGRWIEELSGMENDTLLQLGDSIRDEMSAELAKSFISSVAPAIQQALETLKGTRETLASGVRMLTGEEQGAEMIGAEPGADLGGEIGGAEPDMMNAGGAEEFGGFEEPADEFGASDAAAGGLGDTGRAQRESIDRGNNLLRILAG